MYKQLTLRCSVPAKARPYFFGLAALRDITLVFIMKVNVIVKVKIDVAAIILIILRFIVIYAIL